MEKQSKGKVRIEIILFLILISAAALGNGLSDSVYANYFKEVYNANAAQRGFIEFPRELPGVLCAFVIALLSVVGDIRIAFIAQILACFGITVLGLFTPSFGVMLVFLFINSMGMHLFMPLQDSIGMALAEVNRVGERMGQYASMKALFGFVAGVVAFAGFRSGVLSFRTQIKWVFIISAIAFLVALIACGLLITRVKPVKGNRRKVGLFFRKEYKYYYLLTILNGVQKQIAIVYGTWVIVELLMKGADTVAMLLLIANFVCIFFMRGIGNWIDKFGIRKMMFVDALSFIFVYVIYGMIVWGISAERFPSVALANGFVYLLFILDRLSMQIGIVKAVYLRSIAVDPEDVTATLSTGTSLDHMVSIVAAIICGYIWSHFGSQWVFFVAATFSLGNLYVAFRIKEK